ncbi:MAG: NAD(P)H-dependent oxidoreductase [Actinomycetaceae bacterium]|nr:NAD(P)H-dependent oxidoreductase [Actinomycetaceae bacterium]
MTTVAYIVGSNASNSLNRLVAQAIIADAPEGLEFVEVTITDLPMYTYDNDGDFLALAREKKAAIEAADALMIVAPEYNHSIPGVLKNALDWFSRPWGEKSFEGKKVLLASATASPQGGQWARAHMRDILDIVDAEVVAEVGVQASQDQFGADGRHSDADIQGQFKAAVDAFAQRLSAQA